MKAAIPIFIVEGLDVGIFASLEDAQLQLEPIDVRNGEYTAYDAEGRRLTLEAEGRQVTIRLAEQEPLHAEDLEIVLRAFLKAMKEPKADDLTCKLSCLVEAARKLTHRIGSRG